MQKIAFFFAIFIIGGIATSLCAQPGKHPKWDTALLALEKSDFVVQYSAIKDTIELQIADFHRQKSGLRPEEIAAVKKGYEQSVEQFNKVLNLIKEDFTDPSYRSFMADHPDRFSATLEAELNNALTFYNNNCKSKIDQYVPHGHASLGLMEVGMLITLGKELYKIWSERQAKAKEMSGSYFEERFVSKYRLKKWDHY